jgi:hypothetical protein
VPITEELLKRLDGTECLSQLSSHSFCALPSLLPAAVGTVAQLVRVRVWETVVQLGELPAILTDEGTCQVRQMADEVLAECGARFAAHSAMMLF